MQLVAEEKRELLCKLILASFDLGFSHKSCQGLGRLEVGGLEVDILLLMATFEIRLKLTS